MTYIDLQLSPNRSLSPVQTRWVIIGVGVVMALGGLRALLLGAWPVLPFMVIDVALLVWALRLSHRTGRACEFVHMDDASLTVTRIAHTGATRRISLEPFWVRASLERQPMRRNRLWLTARERRVTVGWFLSPREREEIFEVIQHGLARYREGRR